MAFSFLPSGVCLGILSKSPLSRVHVSSLWVGPVRETGEGRPSLRTSLGGDRQVRTWTVQGLLGTEGAQNSGLSQRILETAVFGKASPVEKVPSSEDHALDRPLAGTTIKFSFSNMPFLP